jgi:hypothetical protein
MSFSIRFLSNHIKDIEDFYLAFLVIHLKNIRSTPKPGNYDFIY